MNEPGFIPSHGGYQNLLSYQKAEVIYDLTYRFCQRFLGKSDRNRRSDGSGGALRKTKYRRRQQGLGNLEGNGNQAHERGPRQPGGTPARLRRLPPRPRSADLEERIREAAFVRKLGNRSGANYETYREICESRAADVVANMAMCLIHQANFLLDQQIRRLEQDFIKEGGLRERMTRSRLQQRNRTDRTE